MSHGRSGFLIGRLWKAGLVLVLAVGLLMPSGNVVVSLSASNGAETGELSVVTEPAGATVFVDGQLAGSTPLNLKGLGVGDHRVRVAKSGYLENVKVVTVGGGKPAVVKVNLTADGSSTESVAAPGSGGKKWLFIGLGAAAVGGLAYVLTNKNAAPTVSGITVSPTGTGMAGQTNFTLTANATDPDGDSLTYSWAYSDGGTSTGSPTTHVFTAAGSPTATVTVSDGKKSATATQTITVGPNVTGLWTGGREGFFGCSINWNLTQSGTNLTGSMVFTGGCTGTITGVTGTLSALSHPTTMNVQAPAYSFISGGLTYPGQTMSFSGTSNATGTTFTGNLRLRQIPGTFDQSYAAVYTK